MELVANEAGGEPPVGRLEGDGDVGANLALVARLCVKDETKALGALRPGVVQQDLPQGRLPQPWTVRRGVREAHGATGDEALAAWRSRPLTASSYPYLSVDARYEHVRVDGRVVSQGVLIVSGVRGDDGRREILAVDVADTESESTYQELFRSLKARGLSGVQLVTSDDHKGLRAAIDRHFQGA